LAPSAHKRELLSGNTALLIFVLARQKAATMARRVILEAEAKKI
jgi:hypothetical protein